MNIVKRFFKSKANYESEETCLIPSGQLYLVRSPSSPKSENECLYNDAVLTIRKTSTPFHYQMVVWKSTSSDSDSLSDEENENTEATDMFFDNESNILKKFAVDESLRLCLFERYHEKIISWRDMEGDFGDMFEYRITESVPNDTIEQFMMSIYKCKYENKYRKTAANADIDDIKEFIVERNDLLGNSLDFNKQATSVSGMNKMMTSPKRAVTDELEYEDDEEISFDEYAKKRNEIDDTDNSEDEIFVDASERVPRDYSRTKNLGTFNCMLCVFNGDEGKFIAKSLTCGASIYEDSKFKYSLEVNDQTTKETYFSCSITEDIDPTFKSDNDIFILNVNGKDESAINTWLLKFSDHQIYHSFMNSFSQLKYKAKNLTEKYVDDKLSEQYLIDSFEMLGFQDKERSNSSDESDSESDSDSEDEDSKPQSKSIFTRRNKVYDESDDESDTEKAESAFMKTKGNSGLAMGLKTNMAFISRGNKIGVFKTNGRDKDIEFSTAIDKLSFSKNAKKPISADKMMLLDNDGTMIIQDRNNMSNLHKIDLEYGKVVEDWKMENEGGDVNIESFTTNVKFGDLSTEKTFLGISSQSMFNIDPRMNKGFISNNNVKNYKTKTKFKQVSTTGKGYIAVASENGEIRLYDSLGKNAKTLLPALGDEIIGLTISNSGRYLLATCKTYLLLIDLMIKDGKYSNKLGFERSFSIDSKPIPKRLQLTPQHMAYIRNSCQHSISFSIATFNESSDDNQEPSFIVTSLGPYAITWNFNKILSNVLNSYKIRLYQEDIVMGDFTNFNKKTMVLALPNNVAVASTSSFRKPSDEFNVIETAF